MDDDRFEREHGNLLAELKATRGPCPDVETLGDLMNDRGPNGLRAATARHVELCPACREIVEAGTVEGIPSDDAAWERARQRLDDRPAPWRRRVTVGKPFARWAMMAAALLVAGLGLGYWLVGHEPGPSRAISETRGGSIRVLGPAGTVTGVEAFEWKGPPVDRPTRLEIRRLPADEPVLDIAVEDGRYEPPSGILRPGQRYRWRVRILGEGDGTIAETPWIDFEIAPDGEAQAPRPD